MSDIGHASAFSIPSHQRHRRKDAGNRAGCKHRFPDTDVWRGDSAQQSTVLMSLGRRHRDVERAAGQLQRFLESEVRDDLAYSLPNRFLRHAARPEYGGPDRGAGPKRGQVIGVERRRQILVAMCAEYGGDQSATARAADDVGKQALIQQTSTDADVEVEVRSSSAQKEGRSTGASECAGEEGPFLVVRDPRGLR